MEVRHIRYFLALAETGNFTRAAALVNVGQSTLSHQIKQLENLLQQQLFIRDKRPVELTAAGQLFVAHAKQALAALDQGILQMKVATWNVQGKLRIGSVPLLMVDFVPRTVTTFMQRFHNVSILIDEGETNMICERVASGHLDIGFCYEPPEIPGCLYRPIFNDRVSLLVADDHPLAKERRIRASQLHGLRIVTQPLQAVGRRILNDVLRDSGAEPVIVIETLSPLSTLHFVAEMKLAALIAGLVYAKPDGFQIIPIDSPIIPISVYSVINETQQISPLVSAFTACIVPVPAVQQSPPSRGTRKKTDAPVN